MSSNCQGRILFISPAFDIDEEKQLFFPAQLPAADQSSKSIILCFNYVNLSKLTVHYKKHPCKKKYQKTCKELLMVPWRSDKNVTFISLLSQCWLYFMLMIPPSKTKFLNSLQPQLLKKLKNGYRSSVLCYKVGQLIKRMLFLMHARNQSFFTF